MVTVKHFLERSVILLKKFSSSPLAIVLSIYILSLLLIGVAGNFPVNDDFYYLMQVKTFSMGIFTKSALVSPTFILQGFLGLLWSKIFGLSYTSLRILTIIITTLCIVGVDKILKLLGIRRKIRFIALLFTTFNPIFYASSLTFMSENYCLLFLIWSVYFFLLFIRNGNWKFLLLSSIIGGMSIMVRQFGVVVFVAYLSVYIFTKRKKINFMEVLCILVPFLIMGGIAFFWPKYESSLYPKSTDITLFFASFHLIVKRLTSTSVLPFVGFILIPFTVPIFLKLRLWLKILAISLTIPLSRLFFNVNVFKMGNLFYLEGLYARWYVSIRQNLFNNVPFKILISLIIAASLVLLVFYLVSKLFGFISKKKHITIPKFENSTELTLVVLVLGFYLASIMLDRLYDRYFVDFFIFIVIYASYRAQKEAFKSFKFSLFLTLLLSLMVFLITYNYYKCTQVKYNLADNLIENQKVERYQIFLDMIYAKSSYLEKKNNFDGRTPSDPQDYNPVCFVQEYTRQHQNILNTVLSYIESRALFTKYFPNTYIVDAGLFKDKSKRFNSTTETLFYDEEYPSPVYNLLGRSTFVRAFCVNNPIVK